MTLREFLLWEERQELRYEFDGFAPKAMTSRDAGTLHHPVQPAGGLDSAAPGKRCYVMFLQSHVAALVFIRKDDDWVSEILDGKDAVLTLPEIGIEIPMAELYADLVLPAEDGEAEA